MKKGMSFIYWSRITYMSGICMTILTRNICEIEETNCSFR